MSTNDFPSTSQTTTARSAPTAGTRSAPYSSGANPCSGPSSAASGAAYAQGSFSARTESWRSSLPHRSRNRLLAGVCGGIAEDMGVSPTLVRLATLALALLPGPIWLAYAVAWVLMPAAD
ncbi:MULTISPECIES: PspC domain-containing protein [Actinomyces]|uniref:PspC domain-containing protein n=1 Tax=Actinomyces TaxID=1654 RepID=UPI001915F1FC|nr:MULTISPECIES: PspC domain-containing protein [Actinomyces]